MSASDRHPDQHKVAIRNLQYLAALARERHFARAAESCNVTQPTLSAGIKQLEESLEVLIVERGQRFIRLTTEGERVLASARRILADYASLKQELCAPDAGFTGKLRIGAIPAVLPVISLLTAAFADQHERLTLTISSQSSVAIQRGLDDFGLDVGLTYLDNEPLSRVRALPLYEERYVLLTRGDGPLAERKSISWQEAATLPLCLLTPDMQNRRILNGHFAAAGVEINARIETNSLITLWSHLRFSGWSSILPHTFMLLLREMDGLVGIPLSEPTAHHMVGLVVPDRDPLPPVAQAFLDFAKKLDLPELLARHMPSRVRKRVVAR
ncbi:MAG TPA: LysR family transcriptional regulator [Aliidongia sp.]|nr:LysR family transcriptional regulator [Aliidongia sp.]